MFGSILVIDDDPVTCEIIGAHLREQGFETAVAHTGEAGIRLIRETRFDLILLDVVLPDLDGNQLVSEIRSITKIPIIMISTRSSDIDKAISLGLGSDDYITKPISGIELIARVRAHLRRNRLYNVTTLPDNTGLIEVGPIRLDTLRRKAWHDGNEIVLTTREFDLLRVFMKNVGLVLTKDQLFNLVWGDDFFDNNTLMVAIRRLRSKIEKDPGNPEILHTVWGTGYRLEWKNKPATSPTN